MPSCDATLLSIEMITSGICNLQGYFGKSAPKIQHLRADSLALLLSLANTGAHAKVTDAHQSLQCHMRLNDSFDQPRA